MIRLILIRGPLIKRIKLWLEVFKIFNSSISGFYPKGGKTGDEVQQNSSN